jgi:cytidylate kinase
MVHRPEPPVICIDGPSGSGKGTVAQRVASALGYHLLDSGALYRLTALAAMRHGVDLEDPDALARTARQMQPAFEPSGSERIHTYLAGDDVSAAIRGERVGMNASQVAQMSAVREALLQRQRDFRQWPGLVADGRDMGTVVFPGAAVKVFLTASAEERARRRYKQLKEKGIDASLDSLLRDIEARDAQDAHRGASPMAAAADAVVVDSSERTIESVTDEVLERARAAIGTTA